jgi:membrane associated rhomboid family serine protease
MTWESRPYAYDEQPHARGGGARSWLTGLPPPGKAVRWILIANAVVFLACVAWGGSDGPIFESLEMRTDKVLAGQVWRLVTCTYVHSTESLGHIFFNMLGLYFLGMPLERSWGPRRFFIFYTLGGLVAVSLYTVLTLVGWLDTGGSLVGASGGVLAVMGGCAVLFPAMQVVLIFFLLPIRTAVLIFTLFYGFNLLTRGANAGGDACHLAGMAFGVAWGYRGQEWTSRWQAWRSAARGRAVEARARSAAKLQEEVDRILEKVHQQGIQSLTRGEKRTLEDASRRERERTRR